MSKFALLAIGKGPVFREILVSGAVSVSERQLRPAVFPSGEFLFFPAEVARSQFAGYLKTLFGFRRGSRFFGFFCFWRSVPGSI